MSYEIYEEIIRLQRIVTENTGKFTPEELEAIRTALNQARSIAGRAQA